MRKCRRQLCRTPLPAAKLSDKWQAKGFCTVDCMAGHGMDKATQARERQHKAETKARKDKIKSKTEWLNEAQAAFNAYVRLRDQIRGLGCISCGARKPDIQYHAGHYRTRKSAPQLRYDEAQVWLQCSACNLHLSGNLTNYRRELLNRIGQQELDRIENDSSKACFTIDDAKRIKAEYKAKLAELKKRQP